MTQRSGTSNTPERSGRSSRAEQSSPSPQVLAAALGHVKMSAIISRLSANAPQSPDINSRVIVWLFQVLMPRVLVCVAIALIAVCCGGSPSKPSGVACGEERWAVKTLSDADATRVNMIPISTTIAEIAGHPAHCDSGPDNRIYDEEFRTYEVIGRATRVALEDDHDYHLVLSDLADSAITMITEIPDPACEGAISSRFVSLLRAARSAFLNLLGSGSLSSLVGQTFRVRGVGFYDFDHGQIGRARNCIELHPLLQVSR